MDRGVTDQELDNSVLAALVAICSAVLVLVLEMGRQQLLYVAINMKLLTAEYFRSVDVVKLMLYSPCEIVNVGLHPTLGHNHTLSQFSKLRVV